MTTTARVDRLHVEIAGPDTGTPVILIHGLGGTTNTWSAMMVPAGRVDDAAERPDGWAGFRTVRLDLPGSGHSAMAGGSLSIADHVEAVRRVAAATGIRRAHVLGHSMGCIVAQHLAAAEPALVASLTLFGPLLALPEAARPVIEARGERARTEGRAGMQAIADALLETAVSDRTRRERRAAYAFVRESLLRQPAAGYAANCEALAGSRPADVATLTCPVLLVTGDEDRVAPPDAVRAMAAQFDARAAVRVVVLSGCGHWHPIEQAEECQRLALDHLQRAARQEREERRRRELAAGREARADQGAGRPWDPSWDRGQGGLTVVRRGAPMAS